MQSTAALGIPRCCKTPRAALVPQYQKEDAIVETRTGHSCSHIPHGRQEWMDQLFDEIEALCQAPPFEASSLGCIRGVFPVNFVEGVARLPSLPG